MNLDTGQLIHRQEFTKLPIPDGVQRKVEAMAEAEGHDGKILLTNKAREEIGDIFPTNQYEDWPEEANLTGVSL
eukprot:12354500-Ditylum_brightwellii.AAC.1